jgi:hypothetical protein
MSRLSKTLHTDDAEVLVAARKLLVEDSGKTLFLNLAAGFQVDLPAPEAGLKYKFVVKLAPTAGGYTIKSNNTSGSATALIKGHVLSADLNAASDGDIDTTAIGTLTFVQSKSGGRRLVRTRVRRNQLVLLRSRLGVRRFTGT